MVPKILFRILRHLQGNSVDIISTVPSVEKMPLCTSKNTKTTWKTVALKSILTIFSNL